MSNDLYRALATLRKDQEKKNNSFFTPHEQLIIALYKARQEKKSLSKKDESGTDVFYRMQQAEKRRRENEDLKKRAREHQRKGGQESSPGSIRDWKARLAPYRSRNASILAHFNPKEMAFLKANPGLVRDVTSRYKSLAQKGQGGDTRLGRISPTTARLLDDLIHHGHKEINKRTGLREYAKCPLCQTDNGHTLGCPGSYLEKKEFEGRDLNQHQWMKKFSEEQLKLEPISYIKKPLFNHEEDSDDEYNENIRNMRKNLPKMERGLPIDINTFDKKDKKQKSRDSTKKNIEAILSTYPKDFKNKSHKKTGITDFPFGPEQVGKSCALNSAYRYHQYLDKKELSDKLGFFSPEPYDPKGPLDIYQKNIEEKNADQFAVDGKMADFARRAAIKPPDGGPGVSSSKYLKGLNYDFSQPEKDLKKDRLDFIKSNTEKGVPVILDLDDYGGPNAPGGYHNIVALGLKPFDGSYQKHREDKYNARQKLLDIYKHDYNVPNSWKNKIQNKIKKYETFTPEEYNSKLYYFDPNYSTIQKAYLSNKAQPKRHYYVKPGEQSAAFALSDEGKLEEKFSIPQEYGMQAVKEKA